MESLEQDFAKIVREHKGTIYTVCYMFSKNEEEVADLFQDILINLWNGFQKFRGDTLRGISTASQFVTLHQKQAITVVLPHKV